MNKEIGIIGLGNIGISLASGLIKGGYSPGMVFGCDIANDALERTQKLTRIDVTSDYKEVVEQPRLIFLCMHTDQVYEFASKLSNDLKPSHSLISMSVGISFDKLVECVRTSKCSVARVVSNINLCSVSAYSVLYQGDQVKEKSIGNKEVAAVLAKVGTVLEVSSEAELDTISLLPSCSPALIALFIESLVASAIEIGVSEHRASEIVNQVIAATINSMESCEITTQDVMHRVSTPGGLVEKALNDTYRTEFKNKISGWLPNIVSILRDA